MMFFSRGRNDKFSELLLQMTSNLQATTKFFLAYDLSTHDELLVFFNTIKKYETKGDIYVEALMKELNHTYITQIDREDILQLAIHLDDILDGIEHCAGLLELYSVTKPTEHMKKFVQKIHECSLEILSAMDCFSRKKLTAITPYSMKIKEIESHTDNLLRMAIKNLFANVNDPIQIIQYKEIYESLEGIVDDCRKVAYTLDSIIMKNS